MIRDNENYDRNNNNEISSSAKFGRDSWSKFRPSCRMYIALFLTYQMLLKMLIEFESKNLRIILMIEHGILLVHSYKECRMWFVKVIFQCIF
jgi:hypothetical protein